ncbi:hypothetical protein ABIA69_003527 [Lysinibacillus parviboronicapiens]|uniref:Uncharacterized protein n=1 Tax=Lysinibacillus parviboronicapiens TaxID=436516 RepID=A0ABV2PN16_9BACI
MNKKQKKGDFGCTGFFIKFIIIPIAFMLYMRRKRK